VCVARPNDAKREEGGLIGALCVLNVWRLVLTPVFVVNHAEVGVLGSRRVPDGQSRAGCDGQPVPRHWRCLAPAMSPTFRWCAA
jgi:hypothetical protein